MATGVIEMSSEPIREAVLDTENCLQLLASQEVGRLVLGNLDPNIRPVNFVLFERHVFIRTDAPLVRNTEVAFEVDQIDPVGQVGWSVVVRGRARPIDVELVPEYVVDRLVPWAPTTKPAWTVIPVETITGRWVSAEQPAHQPDERGYL
jgi:nitroimidazol reductase NimA-like FMN-containing flavoprotein (pyridoxamine 5'-phosphate oxidase superfamily)